MAADFPEHDWRRGKTGFTLVELMVAMGVLVILVILFARMTDLAASSWRTTRQKVESFQAARLAFESIKHRLASATLAPYLDYVDAQGSFGHGGAAAFQPAGYARASDLHFYCGPHPRPGATAARNPGHALFFQTTAAYSGNPELLGVPGLLNACGYYVEYGDESALRPGFLTMLAPRNRYRLYQVLEPTEALAIDSGWIARAEASRGLLAENILALIVLPRLSEADAARLGAGADYLSADYRYDTRAWSPGDESLPHRRAYNQLPPMVRLLLVAVSEEAMQRLEAGNTPPFAAFFQEEELFTRPLRYEADVEKLRAELTRLRLDYRFFQAEIALAEAKWSEQ